MRAALHAEWTKLRTVAGTAWLLVTAVALTVGLSAASAATVTCDGPHCGEDPGKVGLLGVLAGQAAVAVLAVLAVGEEYGTGMIRVTFTQSAANGGHQTSYGDDVYTERLQEVFQAHFGDQAQAYPVFNGTGANVVSLQAMTTRWGSVVCTSTAHIYVDECGAPEKMGGLKLLPVRTPDGKLTPDLVDVEARGFDDVHRAQPQVVSLTQTTELGTAYSVEEMAALCEHAHARGMRVHVDGAEARHVSRVHGGSYLSGRFPEANDPTDLDRGSG